MRGYLVIIPWAVCLVGTTVFLVGDWLFTSLKVKLTGKANPPYFKPRSIYYAGEETEI